MNPQLYMRLYMHHWQSHKLPSAFNDFLHPPLQEAPNYANQASYLYQPEKKQKHMVLVTLNINVLPCKSNLLT